MWDCACYNAKFQNHEVSVSKYEDTAAHLYARICRDEVVPGILAVNRLASLTPDRRPNLTSLVRRVRRVTLAPSPRSWLKRSDFGLWPITSIQRLVERATVEG